MAFTSPPAQIKDSFKKYQKLKYFAGEFGDEKVEGLIDLTKTSDQLFLVATGHLPAKQLLPIFQRFTAANQGPVVVKDDAQIYAHESLPGLLVIPGLLPPEIQLRMLDRLLHRDLSNAKHQTNLHLHYNIHYPDHAGSLPVAGGEESPASFFSLSPDSTGKFEPKDPLVHKPLSISQVLHKKLRWVTLGAQYDWTKKVYPPETFPDFPDDVASLIESIFPETKAQAAIVNLYSPGDTLSLHRDVSEKCDKGLVSISLGCDCIFLVGLERPSPDDSDGHEGPRSTCIAIRLRSGDAVYMSKASRYAWHGVPKIIAGTCPSYLEDWPFHSEGRFAEWRGWMKDKRINLNVRQMYE